MKLLIISDIHSNYEALLAVAHAEKADEIWCLGDLVDYGPDPAEVVQWIRHHASQCVLGNHDYALGFDANCGCSPQFRRLSELSRKINRVLLSPEQIDFLRGLPRSKAIEAGGHRFHLSHGALGGDIYRYDLTPEVSDAILIGVCREVDADFIFCGHTHFPMVRKIDNKVFVNPGAVGLQRDGNWRASYATWNDGKVRLHRVKYDEEKCTAKLRASNLPPDAAEQLARIIETGKGP
jgi:putative phosphoesterase